MKKIKNKPLFIAILDDNTKFIGGNKSDTKWLEIPNNKKIKSLYYRLPSDDFLCLAGYSEYYHLIEAVQMVSGNNKSKAKIKYFHVIAKKKTKVLHYKINTLGQINLEVLSKNHKFIKKLNPNGWKKGGI